MYLFVFQDCISETIPLALPKPIACTFPLFSQSSILRKSWAVPTIPAAFIYVLLISPLLIHPLNSALHVLNATFSKFTFVNIEPVWLGMFSSLSLGTSSLYSSSDKFPFSTLTLKLSVSLSQYLLTSSFILPVNLLYPGTVSTSLM